MKKVSSICVKAIIIIVVAISYIIFNSRHNINKQKILNNAQVNQTETVNNNKSKTLLSIDILHFVTSYPIMFLPPWSGNKPENNASRLSKRKEEIEVNQLKQGNQTETANNNKSKTLISTDILHLVTNYAIMFLPPWSDNQFEKSMSRLMERQEEIEETLQRNLNHPFIKAVHIFINQDAAKDRLNALVLTNKHKLVIRYHTGMPTFRHFLYYANRRLLNEVIVITNMDIYLGEGFENLNVNLMTKYNIAYALTRSGKRERRCHMNNTLGLCERQYIGSHDTYIMKLTEPVSDEALEIMSEHMNRAGSDNRIVWLIKNTMNKKVLNPCHLLKTYHNHCSDIRGYERYNRLPTDYVLLCPPSGLYE